MNDLDRLKQEFIDHVKCGRQEEAARTLAQRDKLLLEELISKSQIARMFDVSPAAVSNWIARHDDFPAPRAGRYARSEVMQWWIDRHPRLASAIRQHFASAEHLHEEED